MSKINYAFNTNVSVSLEFQYYLLAQSIKRSVKFFSYLIDGVIYYLCWTVAHIYCIERIGEITWMEFSSCTCNRITRDRCEYIASANGCVG